MVKSIRANVTEDPFSRRGRFSSQHLSMPFLRPRRTLAQLNVKSTDIDVASEDSLLVLRENAGKWRKILAGRSADERPRFRSWFVLENILVNVIEC